MARTEPSKEKKRAPAKLDLSSASGPVVEPPSPPPKPVTCPICTLQLPLLEAIKTHIREDHPQLYDPTLDQQQPAPQAKS
ncbi:hypothetical protein PGT21_028003 [Puccinia graminis f. sp. tritici]|nr:hypothetical protein PGT21_028003 [Puccinia graminis f. sp. tritici]KAA1139323.1 hypothetical protein PGTUg99_037754 [Puccinia graminis f. sp. tritici]